MNTTQPQETQFEDTIKPIIEEMVINLVQDKPSNVALYMCQWLQKKGGYTSTGLTLDEKKELELLRVKVKSYRDMDEHNKDKKDESFSEEDPDDIDTKLDNPEYTKKKLSIGPRTAVSAEAYGNYYKKENFEARQIPKTEEQIQRIKTRLLHSFLFNSLEPKDLNIVIGAMEEKKFLNGENVIVQGDNGDCIYVLDEGKMECYKQFKKDQEGKLLKEYSPGDSFGELALLYNAPRAATVKAAADSIVWSLDRPTFNHIVKDAAQKKREHYIEVLKKVEILSTIEQYELMQISDALRSAVYQKGDYIIKEGELGDVFYILEEGECIATKTLEPGKPETIIKTYKEGDYFGERALIKGEPRFANIIPKSDNVKVISLDRDSFKRLLGPIENLLQRNIEKYQTFVGPLPSK